MVVGQKATPGP